MKGDPMKKLFALVFATLALCTVLTGCINSDGTTVHILHDGTLWELPDETIDLGELNPSKLKEAIIIDPDVMPSSEGEINVGAQRVQIYDSSEFFLVIIDGKQYYIER